MIRRSLPLGVVLAVAALAPPVEAKQTTTVPYPVADVWPAAIRFIRVDRGFPISEKDESGGYIMFLYADGPKNFKSSLELVTTRDSEGREATQIAVSINDRPRHIEATFIEKLERKIRDERGTPAPPPPKKKAPGDDKKDERQGDRDDKDKARDRKPDGGLPRMPTLRDVPKIEP